MAALAWTARLVLGLFYLAPWAWLAAFGVLLAATIAQFGHMPTYANPDPKWVTGFGGVLMAAYLLIIPVLLSPLVVGADIGVRALSKAPLRSRRGILVVYAVGFAAAAAILFGDAFGLMNWLMD